MRRSFAVVLTFLVATLPAMLHGAAAPRVVVVMSNDAAPYQEALAGLKDAAHASQGVPTFDVIQLHGDAAVLTAALGSGDSSKSYDLVVTLGSIAMQAAVKAKIKTPIVAGLVLNARELDSVPNATGVSLEFPIETELAWLRKFVPGYKRVAVLYNRAENQQRVDQAKAAAEKLGLALYARAVDGPRDIPPGLDDVGKNADVLWGLPDQLTMSPQSAKPVLLFSFRNRVPVGGVSPSWVKAGALYALDRDYRDIGVQMGEMATRIMDGASPSSLPPASPRKINYAINLKTASHMKLELSDELIRGAKDVVE